MHYRKATIEDIPELARIRKMQLHDEGPQPEETMDEELEALFFLKKWADESLIQWVAEDDNQIIGDRSDYFYGFSAVFHEQEWKAGIYCKYVHQSGIPWKRDCHRDSRKVDPGGKAKKDYKIHSLCVLPWASGV